MNQSFLRWNRAVLIGLLFSVALATAQTETGSIGGFVKDPSGAVIPRAKVTLKNEGTGAVYSLATDSAGYYAAPNLPPGMYTMSAEAPGFKRLDSENNRLAPNTVLSLDGNLAVGNTTETVEVTASASVLQTDSAAVQSEVGGAVVNMQELNGRNPLFEAQLLPGMRGSATAGDFNFAEGVTEPFYVNGTRQQDTLVTIDGAPANRTRANGQIIGVPNVDAVEEIQVLSSNYAPEYGRAAGGQIRVITKSGTTDFHGGLYEYFRNSDMNANTWTRNLSTLTNYAQPQHYNNFGGTFGGPVWWPGLNSKLRERLFFFVAEDWIRYVYGDYTVQAVPTLDMRQGNFSELLGPNPWYSGSHVIYDPKTCPSLGAPSCQPFTGNVIPASRLSPNGIAIINAYPLPTPGFFSGTNNFIEQAGHPIDQRKGDMNFDILVNAKNRLSARRSDLSYYEYLPLDQNLGLTPRIFHRPNQTNTISFTSAITPTLLNEARITLSVDDVYIGVNTSAPGFNRENLAMPITFPYILPNGKDLPNKIPTISLPNFSGLAGGPYPSHSSGPIWTGGDNLTKVWNSHTFKFGVSFEYSGENDGDQINVNTVPGGASNQNGTFSFSDPRTGLGATSGIGMANLALGLADAYTEIGPRALTIWRAWMWEWFAQDSWKVTPKLHLDFGVRFSNIAGFHPLWGNADYFDGALYNPSNAVQVSPSTGNVILGTGNPYNGVVIPGYSSFPSAGGRIAAFTSNQCDGASCSSLLAPNLPKGNMQTTNTWQPRLGIAYELNPKTVVRAGIGAFTTRMPLIDNIFPGGNSPFQPFLTVSNVSVDNPGAALTTGTAAPLTMTTLNRNLKPPEAWNWNVTMQRELPLHTVLTVAYVGHHGDHGWQVYDINQPSVGALVANPGINVNALRPYKGFASIQEEESVVNSQYNGLQIQWERRLRSGSSFGVSYTYSKSMDNGSNYRDIVPDTYNTSNLWGPSEYDTRQVALINWVYAIPFLKNNNQLQGKLLGGWSLAGTAQFQTGSPCGIGSNNDYAGVGETGSFGCGSEGQFWTVNGPVTINSGAFAGPVTNSSSPRYFTVNVSAPPSGSFNLQQGVRDFIYQPGQQDWNLALFKTFVVNERANFQFRVEAYDFINHPNLCGQYQTSCSVGGFLNPTSSQFGMITSKSPLARNLQLSLRFAF